MVVTGTEYGLARTLLDNLGLTNVELHASRLGSTSSRVVLARHLYGRIKRQALLAAGVTPPWTLMYSDSWADHDLLDHVDNIVLVDPSSRLRRVGERRWRGRCSVFGGTGAQETDPPSRSDD